MWLMVYRNLAGISQLSCMHLKCVFEIQLEGQQAEYGSNFCRALVGVLTCLLGWQSNELDKFWPSRTELFIHLEKEVRSR